MKLSILRILFGVFLFLLLLGTFSLSVPPGDFSLFVAMFVIACVGLGLSLAESRTWRVVWTLALVAAFLGGALEVVAGKRIAQQRSKNESSITSTNGSNMPSTNR